MEWKFLASSPALPSIHIAPLLLQQGTPTHLLVPFREAAVELGKQQILSRFPLNASQLAVVEQVCAFFSAEQKALPLQLVQGVFGSGKSRLIAVLLILMHSLFQARAAANQQISEEDYLSLSQETLLFRSRGFVQRSQTTVLFCSHTNVAVDRVCLLLLECGFHFFRRMGNIRRIHSRVRPFYGTKKDETGDLRVICTTLCSLPEDVGEVDVVVIDEASQITEYYVCVCDLVHLSRCCHFFWRIHSWFFLSETKSSFRRFLFVFFFLRNET